MSSTPEKGSEIKLPARIVQTAPVAFRLSRQQLRAFGRNAIREDIRRKYPLASRSLRRKAEKVLQKQAWAERDREAVSRITR